MYYRIIDDTENYANYLPSNYSLDLAENLDKKINVEDWQGLHFDLLDKNDVRPTPEFIAGDIPACSKRLYDVLNNICSDSVQFFPCTVGENNLPYYVMNIITVTDAVDYEHSDFHRFPTSGRIMFFSKIQFNQKIQNPFFRIPDLLRTHLFCTEETKLVLESIGVQGLDFSDSLF